MGPGNEATTGSQCGLVLSVSISCVSVAEHVTKLTSGFFLSSRSVLYLPVQFPGEVINYWLQHSLIIFIIPPYLIYIWGMLTAGYEGEGVPL